MRDTARRAAIAATRRSGVGAGLSRALARLPRATPDDAPEGTVFTSPVGPVSRLAVIAHFDPKGTFAEPAAFLATALRAVSDRVIVVSTVPTPHHVFAAEVEPYVDAVVTRRNEGFDFLSWRRGLELARRREWLPAETILTNTSMYGPMRPIDELLDSMFAAHRVWGMTESLDFARHLQSWWLAFDRSATTTDRFARYWRRIRPARGKWGTILDHELGWAREFSVPGDPAVAVAPVARHGCSRNPLFFAWRDLIEHCDVPFVKRSLFFANYDRIDMTGWREFLAVVAPGFDIGMIDRDVDRLGGRTPSA